jgi:AcrR family transcriptional regulator
MSIEDRKKREKQSRIKQIKKSAGYIFEKKGFKAAKMDDIAERADISKATIYKYFKSKDDLFYEIMSEHITKLNNDLVAICLRKEDPEKTIELIVEKTFKFSKEHSDIYNLVTELKASEINKLFSADKVRHLKVIMASNLKQLEIAIRNGIEKGIFRGIEPMVCAIVIWNMFMGINKYQENRLDVGKHDYRRSTLDAGIELLLQGMRKH